MTNQSLTLGELFGEDSALYSDDQQKVVKFFLQNPKDFFASTAEQVASKISVSESVVYSTLLTGLPVCSGNTKLDIERKLIKMNGDKINYKNP